MKKAKSILLVFTLVFSTILYGPTFLVAGGNSGAQIDFDTVNYGDVVVCTWKGVSGDKDMSTQNLPTIKNFGTVPIRLEVWQNDCNFGKTVGVWNVEYKARLSSNGVFTDPYSPEEQVQIPGILYVGQEESLSFSIHVIKGNPGTTYYGTMILTAIQTEVPFEEESFTINLIVKIVNDVGNSPPIVKCKWEYDLDIFLPPSEPGSDPYCQFHDAYPFEQGLQVNPDLGSSVSVGYFAIVTDPNGPDNVDHVYVDIWHPNGEFKYQIVLYPLGFDAYGNYDKTPALNEWDHLTQWHQDLITYSDFVPKNPSWTLNEDIRFELDNEEAYLYFGYAQISYCQPAGYYTVGVRAIDDFCVWSDYLFNQFWYVPTPAVYVDFNTIDYGVLAQNVWKPVVGDQDMSTPNLPTIKNLGNVPVYLTLKQDDMGFGKRIVNGVEEWNVEYKARLSSGGIYTPTYSPELEVVIPGYLGMCTQEKLDFLINVIKGYPTGVPYEGVLDLCAHIYGDPEDWLTPLYFDPAPGGVPQQSPIPINTEIGPLGDETILTVNTISEVLGSFGADSPIVKCKWEYDLDHDHDASDEPGLQVAPIPGEDVKVGYYAILTDPQGPNQIDGVFADVWHFDDVWHPDFNIQVELSPVGFNGGIYDKNIALNEWNHVITDHPDLLTINMDWAGDLPPGTDWWDDISYELDEGEAYLFFGWADLNYLQPSGNYTVGVIAYDNLDIWSDYLYNQFLYIPKVSVQHDFNNVNYGNVVECNWNYVAGDHDMATPNIPTIRNNGNVPVKLYIKQDDMDFGTRIVDGVEEWNVEYKARLSSEGTWTSIYSPDEETEIPGVLNIGVTEKLDFSIHVIKGFPFNQPYTGTMTLTAVQTEAPYIEQTFTINLVANVLGSYGDGAPIIKCKWEYDQSNIIPPDSGSYCPEHDSNPFEQGLQVNPHISRDAVVGYYAIVTDPHGAPHIDHVYADVWYPNGDLKYSVELSAVGFDSNGIYDKTQALNEWDHLTQWHHSLITYSDFELQNPSWTKDQDIRWELDQEEAYLFFGWAKLNYLEAGGNYTVGVNSIDGLDMWSDYLYNQFEYLSTDFYINSTCPVDLIVIDPDGLEISKNINEILGAEYTEIDINGDGSPDDIISIIHRKIGDYIVQVIPEPGADPTDTYSLKFYSEGTSLVLAENVQIGNIPDNPYVVVSTESGIVLDNTPPVTSKIIGNPKHGTNDEWIASNTQISLSATDDLSGVDKTYYRIWYNGVWTSYIEYSGTFTLSGEGKHYLEYYSLDIAGNVEATHNQIHYVDNTPPTVTISASPNILWPPNNKMKNVLILGSATDTGSGIATIVFNVVDEYDQVEPTITHFNQIIQLLASRNGNDKDGRTYTITATATDYLGYVSTASTIVRVPHDQGN